MPKWLLVFVGGGIGALLRYAAALWFVTPSFGWGTFVANVTGCFLIGVLATAIPPDRGDLRLALITGVLGGFTTFSSFGFETVSLARRGELTMAALYALGTNAACLLAAFLGIRGVEFVRGP